MGIKELRKAMDSWPTTLKQLSESLRGAGRRLPTKRIGLGDGEYLRGLLAIDVSVIRHEALGMRAGDGVAARKYWNRDKYTDENGVVVSTEVKIPEVVARVEELYKIAATAWSYRRR